MLLIDIGLNPGVTNVLLDYVLSTSENKLVKSFIENKALEWKRSNINNVPDAMEKAKEERKKKTKTTKTTTKEPSWFDKDIETDELTEEEEKAFRERLKAM
jgi:replication initiation and membrane attachment protein